MAKKPPVEKPKGKANAESKTGEAPKPAGPAEGISTKFVLTGEDIIAIGEEAELLVGGKNYNTALISQIQGIQSPQFRAISSLVFKQLLDETKVVASLVRAAVEKEYARIDWNDS